MFEPLPTPQEMARWDRACIEDLGLRPEVLMENAGRAALDVLLSEFGPVRDKGVLVLAGPGNNGGDAFVLARLLHDLEARVLVLHTLPKKKYRGETRANLLLAQRLGVDLRLLEPTGSEPLPLAGFAPEIVVDGLLGTGLSRGLSPEYRGIVEAVNRLAKQAFVLSLDIPSGLDGTTGEPRPNAVLAHATATFEAAKLGLVGPRAAPFVGKLCVRPIGIPRLIKERHPAGQFLIGERIFELLPAPDPAMHKGKAGHVLVVGGSEGLCGAPQLAGLAALRAGAGLVTLAFPRGLAAVLHPLPDLMTLPLGEGQHWDRRCLAELVPALPRFDALVVGPGLGRRPETLAFLRGLLKECRAPLVLDADALFHLAQMPKLLSLLPANAVLTPHPGEMARLLGCATPTVEADRIDAARRLAQTAKSVTALKGAGTVVATPEGPAHLSPFAEPNLAVGGSGDVLAGIVGSLLARGLSPLHSTCLGVYWHGKCGATLARDFPGRGNLAQEIADALPRALKEHPC